MPQHKDQIGEERRHETVVAQMGHLPGRQEHAAECDVLFKVETVAKGGRVIDVLNDECNVYGVLGSIRDHLENALQFDGVNEDVWTFRVHMAPHLDGDPSLADRLTHELLDGES